MKKKLWIFLSINFIVFNLWVSKSTNGQDLHFSQIHESSVLRNPALIGIFTGNYKVGVIYKSQWSTINDAFQTGAVNFESRFPIGREKKDFLSLGLVAYHDKAGSASLNTSAIYPALNYNKLVNEEYGTFLSVGFTGGYLMRSFDPSKMTFDSQYQNGTFNPVNPNEENFTNRTLSHFDIGAGISISSSFGEYYEKSYYIGVSGYHFTKPKRNFMEGNGDIPLEMKWNINGGFNYKFNVNTALQLHANYTNQGPNNEILAGALLSWSVYQEEDQRLLGMYAGAFYRLNDAVIPMVKLEYRGMSLGVSYDVNISKLKAATSMQGGLEITLFTTGFFKDPNGNRGSSLCPRFH